MKQNQRKKEHGQVNQMNKMKTANNCKGTRAHIPFLKQKRKKNKKKFMQTCFINLQRKSQI